MNPPAKNFLITLRSIYENTYGTISNENFANDIGISKGQFDRYMYRDSPIFDGIKGSALETIVRTIYSKILCGFSWIDEDKFISILKQYTQEEQNYIIENNINNVSYGIKILEWINRKYLEKQDSYSTLDFISD